MLLPALPLGEVLLVITLVRHRLCILLSVLAAVATAYNHTPGFVVLMFGKCQEHKSQVRNSSAQPDR